MLSVLEAQPLLDVAARHLAGGRVQEALHRRRKLGDLLVHLRGDLLGDLSGDLSGLSAGSGLGDRGLGKGVVEALTSYIARRHPA